MTFKHITKSLFLLLGIIMLFSCLNTNQVPVDALTDAQIYSLTTTASYDSLRALVNTKYSIDQLNSQIYNRDSLTYGFVPDKVKLSIGVKYASAVKLYLTNPDSVYLWKQEDSVSIMRLKNIEVIAQDEKTTKKYDFTLNLHKSDPYILVWSKRATGYIPTLALDQRTVALNNLFYTYYKLSTGVYAVSSPDGETKTAVPLAGLPASVRLNTLISTNTGIYALDGSETVYKTTNGAIWTSVTSSYPVKAIYGTLPSTGTDSILTVVSDGGTLKFAKTKDATTFRVLSAVPDGFPINGFSSARIEDPTVYSAKYMILSGGTTANDGLNNQIWLLQEKGASLTWNKGNISVNTQGSTLFLYDQKVYLFAKAATANKNALYISEDYGASWAPADSNQAFPADFQYRTYPSALVDANNYIRIFGGTSGTQTQLTDVWRGRLNKLAVN